MAASLINSIERTTHVLARALDRRLEEVGLDQPSAHVLTRLAEDGPVPAGILAETASRTRSGFTAVLDRLEANGYVTREVNPDDRRSVLVALTQRGVATAAAGAVMLAAIERRVRRRVSSRDMQAFERVLATIEEEARRWQATSTS